jgi:hypothetical protein
MNVSKVPELIVTTPNVPGTMGKVFKLIADSGLNVEAFCAYVQEGKGVFLLVADDAAKADSVLSAAGYETRASEAVRVQVESKLGTGAEIGTKLGDAGVDIRYAYATTGETGESIAIFQTVDNDKAVEVLS